MRYIHTEQLVVTRQRDDRKANLVVGAKKGIPMSVHRAYDHDQFGSTCEASEHRGPEISTFRNFQTRVATPVVNFARSRMSIAEIAEHLNVGRLAVYSMLEQGLLPGIRVGRRWIVTRCAFERWEHTCGTTGFRRQVGGNV